MFEDGNFFDSGSSLLTPEQSEMDEIFKYDTELKEILEAIVTNNWYSSGEIAHARINSSWEGEIEAELALLLNSDGTLLHGEELRYHREIAIKYGLIKPDDVNYHHLATSAIIININGTQLMLFIYPDNLTYENLKKMEDERYALMTNRFQWLTPDREYGYQEIVSSFY